jgi:tetratricopeptide (TPR) repeat protein
MAVAEFLTPDVGRADPTLLLSAAEMQLRTGRVDTGVASVRHYLEQEAEGREQIALLSCRLADDLPDIAFRALEPATDAAAARSDWPWAAAALQEFSRRAPTHVPALLRLVEVCVDGGLDRALYEAQVDLTDAYLTGGAGAAARTLAEDLVDREPWEIANVDRLRRALSLLGEGDPDALIATRLSTPSAAAEATTDAPDAVDDDSALIIVDVDEDHEMARRGADDEDSFGEVDLGEIANAPDLAGARFDAADVDLSLALNDIAPIKAPDLETVFQQLRDEVTKRSSSEAAEAEYQQALALQREGDLDGSIPLLRAAARAPEVRFAAASRLARTLRQRGQTIDAIEWFEHATDAAPEQSSDLHAVMYELADTLEAAQEPARALAVWLGLQADAGAFRDVSARIARLGQMKPRG